MAEAPLKPKSKVKKKKQEKKVFVNKPEEASDEQICDSLCDEVKDDVTVEEERKVTEKIVTVSSCDSEKNEIELDVIKDKSDIEKTETVKEISSIKTINSINVQTPSAPTAEHCPIAENDAYYSAFHELQREIRELNKQTIVHKQPSDVNLYPQLPPEYSLSQKNVNLYPQLPPEYSVLEKSSLSANKHLENKSIHSRNMYPELSKTEYMQYGEMRPKEDVQCLPSESFLSIIKSGKKEYNINREEIRAYTIEQLMNFYDISKILKKNDMFINSFIKNEENVEDKDLFKLILKYQNARQNKKLSKEKLESLRDKFFEDKENVWNIKATSEKFEERCEDKKRVTYLYSYKVAELNEQMHKNVCKNLNDIRNEIKSEFWCHLFAVDYFKLQIENFLFELSSLSTFKDISTQKPVTGYNKRDFSELKNIECLKRSISVLFCFQRRRTDDDEFLKEIQGWLTNLIALLLRIATLEDHLFILNHVLRCPPGVGEWATNFIQFPGSCLWLASKHSYMDSPLLDHIITVFATLLFPIRAREKFLECYKSSVMLATGGETPHDKWVMVTSIEGEDTVEEMDVCDILLRWKESDILGLFQQIPFGDMFKFLLEIKVEDNKEFCKIDNFEEKKMVKLLSIVTWLIYIFREGFNTFQCRKYCDFSKLLGQYISDSVKYICYHWKNFRSSHESVDEAMTKRLQVEFDQFIYRSVASILTSKRKEAWQYLVLPYELVSPETMWHIAWLMVNWHSTESNKLSDSDIITKLQDLKYREMFQEQLCHLKINEITYLVNGLMTMIVSRKQDEKLYVCILTIVVFEISFVASSLREGMSKEGKQLLTSIVERHPYVVSSIIKELKKNLKNIGKPSLYLFKELPLADWKPTSDDVNILKEWLLSDSLTSNENQLARLIISNMNWGIDNEKNCYAVDLDIHRQIAVSIVEAYAKFIKVEDYKTLIMWSFQQLNYLAMILKSAVMPETASPEAVFITWVWETLFSLRLHILDGVNPPYQEIFNGCVIRPDIPNLQQSAHVRPIVEGLESQPKNPVACYVGFMLTSIGHSSDSICEEGIVLFSTLIENRLYIQAGNLLPYIMPFFYNDFDKILRNQMFMRSAEKLLLADITYLELVKKRELPGKVLQFISCIMKCQIDKYIAVGSASDLVNMWLQILIRILIQMNKNESLLKNKEYIYYLLDELVKMSFGNSLTRKALFDKQKHILKCLSLPKQSWGITAALTSFVSKTPIHEKQILIEPTSEFIWFAWFAALIEVDNSDVLSIWKQVLLEMSVDSKMSSQGALKKITNLLNLNFKKECLPIYKWYRQAIATPKEHLLCPLMWQQFFRFFLQKLSDSSRDSVATMKEKFFSNTELQRVASHLREAAKYHQDIEKAFELEIAKKDDSTTQEKEKELILGRNFHQNLRSLYTSFEKLIDLSKQLISFDLESPFEPSGYNDPINVAKMLQMEVTPWYSLFDWEQLQTDLSIKYISCPFYKKHLKQSQPGLENKQKITLINQLNVVLKLQTYKNPMEPPDVALLESLVSDIHSSTFLKLELLDKIEDNKKVLCKIGRDFLMKLSKVEELDKIYAKKILEIYKNEDQPVIANVPCSKGCLGAACFQKSCKQMKCDTKMKNEIEINRCEHYTIYREIQQPFPENFKISAVHITNYLKKIRDQEIGQYLFYYFMKFVDEEIKEFLPIKDFVIEQLEFLGMKYIKGMKSQQMELLKSISHNSYILDFVSVADLFDPSINEPEDYIRMFEFLVNCIDSIPNSILCILLNKFDISRWLGEKKQTSNINQIIRNVGRALCKLGVEINDDKRQAFDIYLKDLQILLLYHFPTYYGEILQLLLMGTDKFLLHKNVWLMFLNSVGYPLESLDVEIDNKLIVNYISKSCLQLPDVSETLRLITNHFKKKLCEISNLFDKYKYYLPAVYNLLTMLGHSLIYLRISSIFFDPHVSINENDVIVNLWEELNNIFEPWTMPRGKVMPWNKENNQEADKLLRAYTITLSYFDDCLFYNDNLHNQTILPIIWKHYVEKYSKDHVQSYVRCAYQDALLCLSWERFVPELEDLHRINELIESKISDNITFVSKIFVKVSWIQVIENSLRNVTDSRENTYVLHELSTLIMKLAWEPVIQEKGNLLDILKFAESCPWYSFDVVTLAEVVDIFVNKCNPDCILKGTQNNSTDQILLKFLRFMTCMEPNEELVHHQTLYHRQLYVSTYIRLIKICSEQHQHLLQISSVLHDCLRNLIQQIYHAVNYNVKSQEKFSQSSQLMTKVLSIFNEASRIELRQILIQALIKWLNENPKNHLILPCLSAASRSLSNMSYLVQIAECCIAQYFSSSHYSIQDTLKYLTTYLVISKSLEEEFIQTCEDNLSYLSLYVYLIGSLNDDQCDITKESKILDDVVEWNRPNYRQISNDYEAKLILLWDIILAMCLRQLAHGKQLVAKIALEKFSKKLIEFGKEGSILSKVFKSPPSFSTQFRFMCRVMAAFITVQVPEEGNIRVESYASGHVVYNSGPCTATEEKCVPSLLAQESVKQLNYLSKNKSYGGLREQIDEALNIVNNAEFSFVNSREVLKKFAKILYDFHQHKFLLLLTEEVYLKK